MTALHKCAKIAQRKAIFSFSFIVLFFDWVLNTLVSSNKKPENKLHLFR